MPLAHVWSPHASLWHVSCAGPHCDTYYYIHHIVQHNTNISLSNSILGTFRPAMFLPAICTRTMSPSQPATSIHYSSSNLYKHKWISNQISSGLKTKDSWQFATTTRTQITMFSNKNVKTLCCECRQQLDGFLLVMADIDIQEVGQYIGLEILRCPNLLPFF